MLAQIHRTEDYEECGKKYVVVAASVVAGELWADGRSGVETQSFDPTLNYSVEDFRRIVEDSKKKEVEKKRGTQKIA